MRCRVRVQTKCSAVQCREAKRRVRSWGCRGEATSGRGERKPGKSEAVAGGLKMRERIKLSFGPTSTLLSNANDERTAR
jgi:hypothetical protein